MFLCMVCFWLLVCSSFLQQKFCSLVIKLPEDTTEPLCIQQHLTVPQHLPVSWPRYFFRCHSLKTIIHYVHFPLDYVPFKTKKFFLDVYSFESQRDKDREFPSIGAYTKCPQWQRLGLYLSKARWQGLDHACPHELSLLLPGANTSSNHLSYHCSFLAQIPAARWQIKFLKVETMFQPSLQCSPPWTGSRVWWGLKS